jgi:hypothetical protein
VLWWGGYLACVVASVELTIPCFRTRTFQKRKTLELFNSNVRIGLSGTLLQNKWKECVNIFLLLRGSPVESLWLGCLGWVVLLVQHERGACYRPHCQRCTGFEMAVP